MEKIIEPIVCKMFRKYITDDAQKEVYVYGATLILTTLLGIVSILLLSAILFSIWDGILFLTVFSVVRTIAGGYHCKTYLKYHGSIASLFLSADGYNACTERNPPFGYLVIYLFQCTCRAGQPYALEKESPAKQAAGKMVLCDCLTLRNRQQPSVLQFGQRIA